MFNAIYRSLRWSLPLPKTPVPVHWLLSILISTTLIGCDGGKTDIPSPTGNTSTPQEPTSQGPRLVISSIQAAPSSGTDCQLPPGSPIVDAFGVPNGDFIEAAIIFPQVFKSTKEFGVVAEDPGIAWTSKTATGLHEKITLTIKKEERLSSSFFIQGKSVNKTFSVVDGVIDDRETEQTDDDVEYLKSKAAIVVWDIRDEDMVDYNAMGAGDDATCYENGPTSPALKSDPDLRVNCGVRAKSVASDGSSYQLARVQSGDYGRACFTVIRETSFTDRTDAQYYGVFSDPLAGLPGENPASNVPTSFQFQQASESKPQYWALGTYTPPTDFYDTAADRIVTVEAQFIPQNENGQPLRSNITAKKKKITIRRPPVLLVHGLWSDSKTWGEGFRNPERGERRVHDKYSYPSSGPFSTEASIKDIKNVIDKLVKESREGGMATTKVDIIAHSMGGLKARRWISDDAFRSDPKNFKQGNVRKLVTLTTPHLGSPLANMLINLHEELMTLNDTDGNHEHPGLAILELGLGGLHGGAVCELADNNRALASGALSGVRSLAYTASAGPTDDWALLIDAGLKVTLCDTPNLIKCALDSDLKREQADPYLFLAPNDKIVDIASQSGGPPVAHEFKNNSHLSLPFAPDGVTEAVDVAREIYAKLDKDSNDANGWATTLSPVTINPLGAIPRRGGRNQDVFGNWIDAHNYFRQCEPGRPMYPSP